jgi:hypothetical protein
VSSVAATLEPEREPSSLRPSRTLSVGFLAMIPLFLCYELALWSTPDSPRNTAEIVLGLALRPLGEHADRGRWGCLALGALACGGGGQRPRG